MRILLENFENVFVVVVGDDENAESCLTLVAHTNVRSWDENPRNSPWELEWNGHSYQYHSEL